MSKAGCAETRYPPSAKQTKVVPHLSTARVKSQNSEKGAAVVGLEPADIKGIARTIH